MFWIPITAYRLWSIDVSSTLLAWLFPTVQVLAWACVYGGSVLLDLPELVGIKQVIDAFLTVCCFFS